MSVLTHHSTSAVARKRRAPVNVQSKAAEPASLVQELFATPRSSWSNVVSRDARYHSPAIVQLLLQKADDLFEATPIQCREIGAVAAQLADDMKDSCHVGIAELRVQAWKDLAQVTSRLGDPQEALRCLTAADAAVLMCSDREHQHAIVEFVRAIVLTTAERFVEARKSLLEARPAFETIDPRRHLFTFHQEAILDALTDDPRAAAQTIEKLIEEVSLWDDETELARLYTVASYAWNKAGESQTAARYVQLAAEIHERKRYTAQMAVDMFRKAGVTAQLGEPTFDFDQAREKLIALGLKNVVVEIDFAYLQAKAAAGADARALHALCARLAADASAAALPVTACEAIDWLRRMSERLTANDVAKVQSFVSESEADPQRPFEPPVE